DRSVCPTGALAYGARRNDCVVPIMSQGIAIQMPLSGLTAAEVAERVARGDTNRVPRSDRAEYLAIIVRNLFTLFNVLVAPAAVALFLLSEYGDAVAVSGMALTNLALGLVQEIRAKLHLDRLSLLSETRVRVRRDGQVHEVPSGDVVRDDVLLLSAGDTVATDGTVLEARFLEVDEALLTGESEPVPHRPGEALLSGSFCVAGEGSYRAERVGVESFAARIASEARSYRYSASPIQHSINRLLVVLTAAAIVLCLGYGVLFDLGEVSQAGLWKMIAATITSMVPQGLVVMATFAFVLGAVRMSRRGALVKILNAVESMASIDTLCMDKTGTLTTNRLHLETLLVLDEQMPEEAIRERLRLFASASLDRTSKSIAALRLALSETPTEWLDQLPFKSQNRYSAVRLRLGTAEPVLVLGAYEALRPFLAGIRAGSVSDGFGNPSLTLPARMLGLRVLLFAEAVNPPQRPFAGALDGFVLRPLALVALGDELRPEARHVLEDLASQGICFKILSGDNADTVRATAAPLTAGANAAAVKALAETPVVSGDQLQAASDPDELIRTSCVFGRVAPAQKVQIIATLKNQGRHVAMIGDGVNDVLPIKNAHLGIAMGDGAAASKTVAGIVLETNNFDLLPETLDEGRTIIRNLRRAGKIFLVKNVFTLILIVGALGVFGLPFPYLPRQVTLLNFLTIGLPTLLIMLNRERSSPTTAAHFLREVGSFALRTGLVIGLAGLLLLWLSKRVWHDDEQTQRTLLLSLLVLLGLTTLLRALSDGEARGRILAGAANWWPAAALLVYLAVMYWRLVGGFFALTPLTLAQWGSVLLIACGSYLLLRLSDIKRAASVSNGSNEPEA
ncbi:MAG TPA: HAD-IC family P-type ATPase, partial [Gemmataceae bacterium]|nr:HAD-IC family P-type ATPase [Gemmataceae bacterium]